MCQFEVGAYILKSNPDENHHFFINAGRHCIAYECL